MHIFISRLFPTVVQSCAMVCKMSGKQEACHQILSLAIKILCINFRVYVKASAKSNLVSNNNVTVQYHSLILAEAIIPLIWHTA